MTTQPLLGNAEHSHPVPHLSSPANAADLLSPHGAEREVGGDSPFLIEGDRCWLVMAGRVEIFVTPVIDRVPGRRTHLFTVEAGSPLFGLEGAAPDGRMLLGVAAPGTRLLELRQSIVR